MPDPLLLTFLLQGLGLGVSAASTPGALQALLINQALSHGWRRGALVGLAPLISDLLVVPWILLLLDRLSPGFLRLVGFGGGLLALRMAYGLWQEWRRAPANQDASALPAQRLNAGRLLLQAVGLNLLSPGIYTFWTLVNGPLLLSAWQISALHAASFASGFYLAFSAGNLVLALIFSQAKRLGRRAVRLLQFVSLVILALMAGLLLYRGIFGTLP